MDDWLDYEECALCGAEDSLSFDDGEIWCCCCDDYSYPEDYPGYKNHVKAPTSTNVIPFTTQIKNPSSSLKEVMARTRRHYIKSESSYGRVRYTFTSGSRPSTDWEQRINKNINYYKQHGKLPG
jgi:hypothetical protein